MSLFVREQRAASLQGASGVLSELLALRGMQPRNVALQVTPNTAMKHSAVAACVQLIANLAMLDVRAYEKADGLAVVAEVQPQILRRPSAELDPFEWRRQVFLSWLTRGTAFGLVAATDRLGFPTQIELIPADCVTVDGHLGDWSWRVNGKLVDRFPNGQLWMARGLHSLPGQPVGISPIEMALGAIGLGLAAEDFGQSWFRDGAHPSSVLTTDQPVTSEAARTIKERFIESVRGRREPVVLGAGIKVQQISVAADESQFLDTIEKNAAQICRWFLVPPSEIGAPSGESMTYANAESRALALLSRTFQPWITRLEYALRAITPPALDVRVDVSDLIRTDITTRTNVDVQDLRAGIRSRDEIRATRGLGATPGGDEYARLPFGTVEEQARIAAAEAAAIGA